MTNQTILILTLIVLLCYGALLALDIPTVKRVYFIGVKVPNRDESTRINVSLRRMRPAIYIKRWWRKSIQFSIHTGLFVVEGSGYLASNRDVTFQYEWLSLGGILVGIRTGPDKSHGLSVIKLRPEHSLRYMYVKGVAENLFKENSSGTH